MRLPSLARPAPPAVADPDAAEVARAREGDETAFEALLRRHQRQTYNLALRMLGDREDALEAVQDAFLRAFRALPRFRAEAAFRTWLVGITLNVCRNRLASAEVRSHSKREPLVRRDPATGEDVELPLPDGRPDPEAATAGGELRAALARALAALSPEHREIVLLREMAGLEYEEIAAALSCAVGTVKSRLARARAALRESLEGVWP